MSNRLSTSSRRLTFLGDVSRAASLEAGRMAVEFQASADRMAAPGQTSDHADRVPLAVVRQARKAAGQRQAGARLLGDRPAVRPLVAVSDRQERRYFERLQGIRTSTRCISYGR